MGIARKRTVREEKEKKEEKGSERDFGKAQCCLGQFLRGLLNIIKCSC